MRCDPDRGLEKGQVFSAWNGNRAELREMRGYPLSIKKLKTPFPQARRQTYERNLRCTRDLVKHRLAEESAPDPNPVETAGKPPVAPDLQRMGVARAM